MSAPPRYCAYGACEKRNTRYIVLSTPAYLSSSPTSNSARPAFCCELHAVLFLIYQIRKYAAIAQDTLTLENLDAARDQLSEIDQRRQEAEQGKADR